jgi:hypothetical protein
MPTNRANRSTKMLLLGSDIVVLRTIRVEVLDEGEG